MPLRLLSVAVALLVGVAACSDDVECTTCGSGGSGATSSSSTTAAGGAACDGKRGTLAGDVFQFAAPPDPNAAPAAGALVELAQAPGDTPLTAMADDQGHYSVEIEPGTWFVSGDDGSGCITDGAVTVTVEACTTTTQDLVLELCAG